MQDSVSDRRRAAGRASHPTRMRCAIIAVWIPRPRNSRRTLPLPRPATGRTSNSIPVAAGTPSMRPRYALSDRPCARRFTSASTMSRNHGPRSLKLEYAMRAYSAASSARTRSTVRLSTVRTRGRVLAVVAVDVLVGALLRHVTAALQQTQRGARRRSLRDRDARRTARIGEATLEPVEHRRRRLGHRAEAERAIQEAVVRRLHRPAHEPTRVTDPHAALFRRARIRKEVARDLDALRPLHKRRKIGQPHRRTLTMHARRCGRTG